ncbi:hypothetical protein [Paenibacillus sp. DYY-L-2]|uniref:hypothetical protein n=1 Tax=Paenibacillus sp. DYY-L-2 TaxID=3447013 RepID=UPI003F502FD5
MLKKMTAIVMAFMLIFAFTSPDLADAKRGGGFKSGPRTFNPEPKKPATSDNVRKSDGTTTNKTGATTGTNANRGFFSGGSFMKGLMIGGFAGLLFGGLFGNMGFLGNLLGLAVNLLVIYAIIAVGVWLFRRFKRRPQHDDHYRGGRY